MATELENENKDVREQVWRDPIANRIAADMINVDLKEWHNAGRVPYIRTVFMPSKVIYKHALETAQSVRDRDAKHTN